MKHMQQLKWFKQNHDQSKLSPLRTHKCCSSYYHTLNKLKGLLDMVLIAQTVTSYSNLQRLVPDSILSAKWRLSKIQTNKQRNHRGCSNSSLKMAKDTDIIPNGTKIQCFTWRRNQFNTAIKASSASITITETEKDRFIAWEHEKWRTQ